MQLCDCGIITSNDKTPWSERAREVVSSLREVLRFYWGIYHAHEGGKARGVAVEFPGVGVGGTRNVAHLPKYGVAVGWAMAAVFPPEERWPWSATPTASEWSRAIGAPGTKGDPHKLERQRYVRQVLGFEFDASDTRGADVADAILIATWAAREMRMDMLRNEIRGVTPLVLAIDPSMTSTGYAILKGDPA